MCGKLGNRLNNMKRHVISVHYGEKNLKCTLCDGKYSTQNSRQIHYKEKHGLMLSFSEIREICNEEAKTMLENC